MSRHRFAALKRLAFLVTPLIAAATLAAQTPCSTSEQVGWLGIDGLECNNCEFGRRYARFSTEPRITSVAAGSPAAAQLRAGDLIVSVNGALITTEEGAARYSNAKPGQDVTLLVRRDGQLMTMRFLDIPGRCPGDSEVRAAIASRVPPGRPGSGRLLPTPAAPGPRAGGFGGSRPAVAAAGGMQLARVNRVVFGFGISCSGCTMSVDRSTGEPTLVWQFKSPPELYSVEPDGPAWKAGLRRGDVITQIDGIEVTTAEAGRRFGAVQPGENVRFTYRRGNESRTVTVAAQENVGIVAGLAGSRYSYRGSETEAALTRMRQLLADLASREREEQNLVERMRETGDERLRETLEKYHVEQAEQQRKLRELVAQLNTTENRVRAVGPARGSAGFGGAVANTASSNTMRYSGELGNVDIEIRGSRPVVVDESADEIVIRTGDAEIRLKRRTPR